MIDGLGSYVRERRRLLRLTQQELSDRIGVNDDSYISRVETGNIRLPGVEIRRKLAKALEVSEADLLVAAGELDAHWLEHAYASGARRRDLYELADKLNEKNAKAAKLMLTHMLEGQPPARPPRRRG